MDPDHATFERWPVVDYVQLDVVGISPGEMPALGICHRVMASADVPQSIGSDVCREIGSAIHKAAIA
jgi:hypothetical protein